MQLDRIFSRRRKPTPEAPPKTAHGQRNLDGSYFSVWLCENGHGQVADTGAPPKREDCYQCTFGTNFDKVPCSSPVPAQWRLASREEAHAYIFGLEGFGMYSGVGFRML